MIAHVGGEVCMLPGLPDEVRILLAASGRTITMANTVQEALRGLRDGGGSLLLIGPRRHFTSVALLAVASRLVDGSPIGIIVTEGVPSARYLPARRLALGSGRRLVLVHSIPAESARQIDVGARVLSLDDPESERAVADLGEERWDVLAFEAHSDAIDASLPGAVLCGLRTGGAPGSEGWLQTCAVNSALCRRDPAGQWRRIPASALCARLLVAEACSFVAGSDGLYADQLALVSSAQSGGVGAVLAPMKAIRTTGVVPPVASALAASGRSFGEVAAGIAELHTRLTGDQPSYVLFGDPDERLAPTGAHQEHSDQTLDIEVPSALTEDASPLAELPANLLFLELLADKAARAEGLRPTAALAQMATDLAEAIALVRPHTRGWHREQARAAVRTADALIARAWPAWDVPHYLAPFYAGFLEARGPERHAGDCGRCATPTFAIRMCPTYPGLLSREITHCPRCGVIADLPAGAAEFELLCDESVRIGGILPFALSSPATEAAYAVDVEGRLPWFRFSVQREGRVGQLHVVDDSLPGVYHLVAASVQSLGISVATRPLAVVA